MPDDLRSPRPMVLKPQGFKDQLLPRAQLNAETAGRLVNASRFDPLCRQLRADLSKGSFS
jgi:hypothetical protein